MTINRIRIQSHIRHDNHFRKRLWWHEWRLHESVWVPASVPALSFRFRRLLRRCWPHEFLNRIILALL
jgi:hypothetical protein